MKRVLTALLVLPVLSASLLAQLVTGQSASHVIGQPDFTSTGSSAASSTTLNQPSHVAVDPIRGKLYIADTYNNRVLRYSYPFTGNQPAAEFVFGQSDMITSDPDYFPSPEALNMPVGLALHNDTLWVCDQFFNRVLRFDNASTRSTYPASANGVLGQSSFDGESPGSSTGAQMNVPVACAVAGNGTLWVADGDNHRVLRFDNASAKSNGASADGVLGWTTFVSGSAPTPSRSQGQYPSGVALDAAGRLWVIFDESRVLRFDNAQSKENGADADAVLGQSNFTSVLTPSPPSQSSLSGPTSLACDQAGGLYVGDASNHRVLVFAGAASKSNGANADVVLGNDDFTSISQPPYSASTLNFVSGVATDTVNNALIIADKDNHRILIFESSGPPPVQLTDLLATARGSQVLLRWETATEEQNAGFEIERRREFGVWQTVSFVEGHGTTNSPNVYEFIDDPLPPGTYMYRLKQIDRDGSFRISHEVQTTLMVPEEIALAQNYPNPFNPVTTIGFELPSTSTVDLKVFDLLGREVAHPVEGVLSAGAHRVSFSGMNLPSGTYVYRLQANGVARTRAMTLLR